MSLKQIANGLKSRNMLQLRYPLRKRNLTKATSLYHFETFFKIWKLCKYGKFQDFNRCFYLLFYFFHLEVCLTSNYILSLLFSWFSVVLPEKILKVGKDFFHPLQNFFTNYVTTSWKMILFYRLLEQCILQPLNTFSYPKGQVWTE